MKKIICFVLITVFVLISLCGCDMFQKVESVPYAEQTDENSTFSDDLYIRMPKDENYIFSPVSIKMSLAMAANGAQGETKEEILEALGIKDIDAYNDTVKWLMTQYNDSEVLKLDVSNSAWINTDSTDQRFSSAYKNKLEDVFNATVGKVTNKNAAKKINGWAKDKTNGKIPSVIEENNTDFWALLANAVYFRGRWADEFSKKATKDDYFTDRKGKKHTIPFMNRSGWMNYTDENGVKIIEIPYLNREDKLDNKTGEFAGRERLENIDVSMYVMMSDNSFLPEKSLKEANFSSVYADLSLPKFDIEYSTGLEKILKDIGVKKAFTDVAEFGDMFNEGNMFISDILHKTYITVDEEGTEAAAVTALFLAGSSMPSEPLEVKFDKPFTFVVWDNINKEALFIGEYAFVK